MTKASTLFKINIPSALIEEFSVSKSYSDGDIVRYRGYVVTVQGNPAAGPFVWGTAINTWRPVAMGNVTFKGPFTVGAAYNDGDVVSAGTSGDLYIIDENVPVASASIDPVTGNNKGKWRKVKSVYWATDLMSGASGGTDGQSGEIPSPLAGDNVKFLRGDGNWAEPNFTIPAYDSTASYITGDIAYHLGQVIVANSSISVGATFEWGTLGATWRPIVTPTAKYRGLYDVATAYAVGDIVNGSDSTGYLYKAIAATTGNPVTDSLKWEPYVPTLDLSLLSKTLTVAFTGATALVDGTSGSVPAPLIADKDKVLVGDGTWKTIDKSDSFDVTAANTTAFTLSTTPSLVKSVAINGLIYTGYKYFTVVGDVVTLTTGAAGIGYTTYVGDVVDIVYAEA